MIEPGELRTQWQKWTVGALHGRHHYRLIDNYHSINLLNLKQGAGDGPLFHLKPRSCIIAAN